MDIFQILPKPFGWYSVEKLHDGQSCTLSRSQLSVFRRLSHLEHHRNVAPMPFEGARKHQHPVVAYDVSYEVVSRIARYHVAQPDCAFLMTNGNHGHRK